MPGRTCSRTRPSSATSPPAAPTWRAGTPPTGSTREPPEAAVTTYIVRRVGQSVPTLFLVTLVLFFGMHALPGGPLAAFAFNPRMSPLAQQAIIHHWGLDQPLYIQYFSWLKSMLTGDWQ